MNVVYNIRRDTAAVLGGGDGGGHGHVVALGALAGVFSHIACGLYQPVRHLAKERSYCCVLADAVMHLRLLFLIMVRWRCDR